MTKVWDIIVLVAALILNSFQKAILWVILKLRDIYRSIRLRYILWVINRQEKRGKICEKRGHDITFVPIYYPNLGVVSRAYCRRCKRQGAKLLIENARRRDRY